MQGSRDFEEVHILHEKYLDSIVEQCFLNLPDVLKALQGVLHMCTQLCRLLRGIDEDQMQNKSFEEQFWKLKVNFERQSNQVFQLLSNFKNNHQSAPFLA